MLKKTDLTDSERSRKEDIIRIQELLKQGYTPSSIRKLTGHTYRTIRKYKEGEPENLCRCLGSGGKRQSILDCYADSIIQKLTAGTLLKEIYNELTADGYKGKMTYFYRYCKTLIEETNIEYHTSKNIVGAPINHNKLNFHYISRRAIVDHLWSGKEINDGDKKNIFEKYPLLYEIQACIREFRKIFDEGNIPYLYFFIERYKSSENKNLKTLANGLLKDIDAIENAVSSPYSNGFLEGNNNRLKMIKRTMYGRAGLPLLRAKILH